MRPFNFRVQNIPAGMCTEVVRAALRKSVLRPDELHIIVKVKVLVQSCETEENTQVAFVEFSPKIPEKLNSLNHDNDLAVTLEDTLDEEVYIDRNFYGLTQLYPTRLNQKITLDIVAVTRLGGHAFGSWRRRNDNPKMWLQDFLPKRFPNCRTMIYGYDSTLSSRKNHEIEDYTKTMLETLDSARKSEEEKLRPIVFIGHSFGGIIILQSIVKARDQRDEPEREYLRSIFESTYGIFFFATPQHGMVVDDMMGMVKEHATEANRGPLVQSIKACSSELRRELDRFKKFCSRFKIVSFYELSDSQKLQMKPREQGKPPDFERTGEYHLAVPKLSATLGLPGEETYGISANHSDIAKFTSNQNEAYKYLVKKLKAFEEDATSRKYNNGSLAPYVADPRQPQQILMPKPDDNGRSLLHYKPRKATLEK